MDAYESNNASRLAHRYGLTSKDICQKDRSGTLICDTYRKITVWDIHYVIATRNLKRASVRDERAAYINDLRRNDFYESFKEVPYFHPLTQKDIEEYDPNPDNLQTGKSWRDIYDIMT